MPCVVSFLNIIEERGERERRDSNSWGDVLHIAAE